MGRVDRVAFLFRAGERAPPPPLVGQPGGRGGSSRLSRLPIPPHLSAFSLGRPTERREGGGENPPRAGARGRAGLLRLRYSGASAAPRAVRRPWDPFPPCPRRDLHRSGWGRKELGTWGSRSRSEPRACQGFPGGRPWWGSFGWGGGLGTHVTSPKPLGPARFPHL